MVHGGTLPSRPLHLAHFGSRKEAPLNAHTDRGRRRSRRLHRRLWRWIHAAGRTHGTAPQVTTTHLTVDGVDTVVELQAVQLAVTAHRSDGSTPDVTALATWAASDPRVATVAAGRVTGENHGTATITAEYDGKSQGHDVTVTRRPAMQCFVAPATDTPWGIEKSTGPPDRQWRAVRVTYRLLNDCTSRVRTSRFRVQVWDNPDRIGQRISTGAMQ